MDATILDVYEITMDSGDSIPTPAESMLRLVQVALITSRWCRLDAGFWTLDLCSPFWRLYAHRQAGASIHAGSRRLDIRPDRLVLVPAWVGFRTAVRGEVHQDFMHFVLTGFPAALHRRIFTGPIELRPDEALTALVERWRSGLAGTTPSWPSDAPPGRAPGFDAYAWANATAHAALAQVFAGLDAPCLALCQAWLHGSGGIRPALDAIERRLDEPPGNAELARLCGLGVNQFIRRFRAAVGMTPARYGQERRVAVAATWLLDAARPIDDIAASAGFTDRYHFTRVFRARLGVAPAAWRRRHAAGG